MSPLRSRATKPKVRTGCKTCKARRVKCDETKPQCLRCLKLKKTCGGYDDQKYVSVQARDILPMRGSSRVLVPLAPQPSAAAALKGGENEHRYFHYFRDTTAIHLSGGYDDAVWNRIVLQVCHDEPSIHRIVISIGALTRAMEMKQMHGPRSSISAHHRYAFHEYGKALKGVRQMAKSKGLSATRSILVASILIYMFESLHGNIDGVIGYLRSALAICLRDKNSSGTLIYRHLEPSSPSIDVEDELITAFARLDGNLGSSLQENRSWPKGIGIHFDYDNESYIVPSRFSDPVTARIYIEHIQYRARPNVSNEELEEMPDEAAKEALSSMPRKGYQRVVAVEEIALLKVQLAEWFAAFDPLFKYARTPAGKRYYMAATTLRVQAVYTLVILEGNLGFQPTNDVSPPNTELILLSCREVLSLAKGLVANPEFSKGVVFDLSLLPYMLGLVISTPEVGVAREAVALLKNMIPRREGTWKSTTVAKMAESILQMKEAAVSGSIGSGPGVSESTDASSSIGSEKLEDRSFSEELDSTVVGGSKSPEAFDSAWPVDEKHPPLNKAI